MTNEPPTDYPIPPVLAPPCAECVALLARLRAAGATDDPYADRDDAPANDEQDGAA